MYVHIYVCVFIYIHIYITFTHSKITAGMCIKALLFSCLELVGLVMHIQNHSGGEREASHLRNIKSHSNGILTFLA